MASKLRFSILLGGTLVVLVASTMELAASFQSGVASLPLGRRGAAIQFSRTDSPVGFYACVAVFAALALLALWYAGRQVRALLNPRHPRSQSLMRESIAQVERSAPSGLRPLWVGLVVFAAVLLALWALAE